MKRFMITFRNLKNNFTLDTQFNARTISDALLDADGLCERFKEHDIRLEVMSIYEIDEY